MTQCCLELEVYYRYLLTFDIPRTARKIPRKGIMDMDDGDDLIIE